MLTSILSYKKWESKLETYHELKNYVDTIPVTLKWDINPEISHAIIL